MKKTILLFMAAIFVLQSCNKEEETTVTPTPNAVRLVETSVYGKILADSNGRTLYFYSQDSKNVSNCPDGSCTNIWPIFYKENLTLDQGLVASDFGTITRPNGVKQTTYKGWPLYYFHNDIREGEVTCDKFDNIWYVAKPDYSLMYVQAQLVGKDANGNNVNYKSDYTLGDGLTFYITNDRGRTLYTFSTDKKDTNNFTNSTFSNNGVWPIFYVNLDKIPSILNKNDFGTITVYGRQQITYKGWPLYYYGQDTNRGDNYGINFPTAGKWPVPNASTMLAPMN